MIRTKGKKGNICKREVCSRARLRVCFPAPQNKWVSTQIRESLNISALLWVGKTFKTSWALFVSSPVCRWFLIPGLYALPGGGHPPGTSALTSLPGWSMSCLPPLLPPDSLPHDGGGRLPVILLGWAGLLSCMVAFLSFHWLHIYCEPSGLSLSWGEDAWFVCVHPIQLGLSFVWGRKEEEQRTEGWWRGEIIYFFVMLQYIQI